MMSTGDVALAWLSHSWGQNHESTDEYPYYRHDQHNQRDPGDRRKAHESPRGDALVSVTGVIPRGRLERNGSVGQILSGDYMSDAELRVRKCQHGQRAVELRIAARLENLAVVRTLVGAISTFADLDFDAVADLRLAVDEVCTRLIRSAQPDAVLSASSSIRETTSWWWKPRRSATPTMWWPRAASAGMS
jgi:hypothetical protein